MPDPTNDFRKAPAKSGAIAGELARLGIAEVPVTFFEGGGYRYSNVHDAIAAAKRLQR